MRLRDTVMLTAAGLAVALVGSARVAAQEKTKCAVQGVEVTLTDKTKTVLVNGEKLAFCCANCAAKFAATPEKFVTKAGSCPVMKEHAATVSADSRVVVNNNLHYVCCPGCPPNFVANLPQSGAKLKDPVSGSEFTVKPDSPHAEVNGQHYYFASAETKAEFDKNNAKYVTAYGK